MSNVVRHVGQGTPRFAMFNENQKPEGVEKNFGLFRPNMTEIAYLLIELMVQGLHVFLFSETLFWMCVAESTKSIFKQDMAH
ncbi:hypothetical protein PR202_gb04499 [Eleusine coracana subsp. coracana]|uniref:Uncharacterized protein n=1 Tax=Eleusine coracana subsp. coracana TaxID=191504 RepID=A0AAV5E491_ELECO|nr:hypothetical protein PR202_gb04499 [Eleusine coracana subsp. coracana]